MSQNGYLLILALCGGVYFNSLHNSFHYDDIHSIFENFHLRSLANIPAFFSDPAFFSVDAEKVMYRPLLLASYALNFALGGFAVEGYHLFNILLHGINACLVAWLGTLLSGRPWAGLAAGLLFVAHPLGTEPVNYLSSRSDSLAGLFYLLGLGLFIRAEQGNEPRKRPWVRLALVLGLLSKETAITLPAVLLLYDYLFLSRQQWGAFGRNLWRRHGSYWLIGAAYVLVIHLNGFLPRSLASPAREAGEQLATQLKAVVYYGQLLLMPVHLNVEHQFFPGSLPAIQALLPLLVILSLLRLLWRCRRQQDGVFFLALFALLALLPVLVMPLNVLVNERRLYLPAAALCMGLGWLLTARRQRVGVGVLVALCAALSWQRNQAWASELSLWRDAVQKAPLMPRAQLYLGNAHKDLAQQGDQSQWQAAASAYQQAAQLDPQGELGLRALNNQGSVYLALGELSVAERLYRQAVERNPRYEDALVNLGTVCQMRARELADPARQQDRLRQAISYYERALAIRPNHYEAYGNLGVAFQDLGEYEKAQGAYQQALHLNPNDPKVLKNLGTLFSALGKAAPVPERRDYLLQAREYFLRAAQLGYGEAREGVAQVERLLQEGR